MRKITDTEIKFFDDHGYVICRGVLASDELAEFDRESRRLIDDVVAGKPIAEWCGKGPEGVPFYLNYLHAHANTFSLRLLGHPFIGDLLTRMVGPDFVPCYESLVFKLPSNGSSVPWHRDGQTVPTEERIFNIDVYPDHSTVDNACVWVVPGSHKWERPQADEMIRKGRESFALPGAVPAEMKPGDALIHHTKVLHGSEVNRSGKLRRVVYFDNRAANWIRKYKWFEEPFIQKRYKLYQIAWHERRSKSYPSDDEKFSYAPPADAPRWKPGDPVDLHASRGDAMGADHDK